MNPLNDLCTREDRLVPLPDPLALANKRLLTDAWPIALMLAVMLFVGFTLGHQCGYRDGAQSILRNSK